MNIEKPKPVSEDHDISKYPADLTGWGGCDLNTNIARWELLAATRVRLGTPGQRRGLYKAGLARMPNGDLIATPCRNRGDEKGTFQISVFRSQDNGDSWSEISETPLYGKEPGLTALRDGTLILTAEDLAENTMPVSRSQDGGNTWTTINLGERRGTVRNLIEERDGGLLMFKGPRYSGKTPTNEVWLYRSTDQGATWRVAEKTSWLVSGAAPEEPHVIELADGRLLAVVRVAGTHPINGIPAPPGFEAGDHLLLTESRDRGLTWSTCRDFLGYAKVHGWLTLLRDGRLLCTYATYHHPFGVFAVLSRDLGATWDTQHPIQLAISSDVYVGWPVSIQLPDDSLLTSYATTVWPMFRDGTNTDMSVCEVMRWGLPG